MVFSANSRRTLYEHDALWRTKLFVRILATALALVAIAFFADAITVYKGAPPLVSSSNIRTLIIAIVPLSWCVLWNAFNFAALSIYTTILYPALSMSGDLLTLLAILTADLTTSLVANAFRDNASDNIYPSYTNRPSNGNLLPVGISGSGSVGEPAIFPTPPLVRAGAILTWIVIALHLVLLIIAIHDRRTRRRERKGQLTSGGGRKQAAVREGNFEPLSYMYRRSEGSNELDGTQYQQTNKLEAGADSPTATELDVGASQKTKLRTDRRSKRSLRSVLGR